MRSSTLIALALSLPVIPCYGQDAPERPTNSARGPDHLVPVDPLIWSGRYPKLLRRTFGLDEGPVDATVMIYEPSFSAEEVLVLRGPDEGPQPFTLIHTRANPGIYRSMAEDNVDRKPKRVELTRKEAPLPPELAGRVGRMWERMLLGTRYPKPADKVYGADGVTIEFWRDRMYGETWSPKAGAPRLLVDLGRSLIDYCDAAEGARPAALKEVERRCQALETYIDKNRPSNEAMQRTCSAGR
jgi:hypothetical protein